MMQIFFVGGVAFVLANAFIIHCIQTTPQQT